MLVPRLCSRPSTTSSSGVVAAVGAQQSVVTRQIHKITSKIGTSVPTITTETFASAPAVLILQQLKLASTPAARPSLTKSHYRTTFGTQEPYRYFPTTLPVHPRAKSVLIQEQICPRAKSVLPKEPKAYFPKSQKRTSPSTLHRFCTVD